MVAFCKHIAGFLLLYTRRFGNNIFKYNSVAKKCVHTLVENAVINRISVLCGEFAITKRLLFLIDNKHSTHRTEFFFLCFFVIFSL